MASVSAIFIEFSVFHKENLRVGGQIGIHKYLTRYPLPVIITMSTWLITH